MLKRMERLFYSARHLCPQYIFARDVNIIWLHPEYESINLDIVFQIDTHYVTLFEGKY